MIKTLSPAEWNALTEEERAFLTKCGLDKYLLKKPKAKSTINWKKVPRSKAVAPEPYTLRVNHTCRLCKSQRVFHYRMVYKEDGWNSFLQGEESLTPAWDKETSATTATCGSCRDRLAMLSIEELVDLCISTAKTQGRRKAKYATKSD